MLRENSCEHPFVHGSENAGRKGWQFADHLGSGLASKGYSTMTKASLILLACLSTLVALRKVFALILHPLE
ncbi:hypothetical protein DQ400_11275 [Vreelandella sulfidaeris]|uniref:Uncharacterized protein n=1 Tax=Vreelandella sulfidaeris TaxID=115553 RepID=A0A365TMZ5_9GAMM|nr:hypothetical protein DQ400_11275 [Halomonas sulfidaeris]